MRKNGKRVLLVTMLMCVLGTLPVHAQSGFTPVQGLAAYDSIGRRIGNVIAFGGAGFGLLPSVAFSKDNTTVVLDVGKNRLLAVLTCLSQPLTAQERHTW